MKIEVSSFQYISYDISQVAEVIFEFILAVIPAYFKKHIFITQLELKLLVYSGENVNMTCHVDFHSV